MLPPGNFEITMLALVILLLVAMAVAFFVMERRK